MTTAEGRRRAGYRYDDRTGISYEYPSGRYENWIVPGERFLYHKPGKGYTGTGVIGNIAPSEYQGRLVCEILDHRPFLAPVPIRDSSGAQYEADSSIWSEGNVYWAQGVRRIAEDRFERIVTEGKGALGDRKGTIPAGAKRAAGDNWIPVDEYAMTTALAFLALEYPGLEIERMPHNNPGFDIRVGPPVDPHRYVEVKGTQTARPVFFLSEGERAFSARYAERFTLLVVVGIDLEAQSHASIELKVGEVSIAGANLEPVQWRGYLDSDD